MAVAWQYISDGDGGKSFSGYSQSLLLMLKELHLPVAAKHRWFLLERSGNLYVTSKRIVYS